MDKIWKEIAKAARDWNQPPVQASIKLSNINYLITLANKVSQGPTFYKPPPVLRKDLGGNLETLLAIYLLSIDKMLVLYDPLLENDIKVKTSGVSNKVYFESSSNLNLRNKVMIFARDSLGFSPIVIIDVTPEPLTNVEKTGLNFN